MSIKPAPKRYGNTRKKNLTLTNEGHDQIETYAKAHGLSFSAAMEALALIGMEADITSLLIPLINTSVEKGFQRHFNRIAKLSLIAAAESAMAHDMATIMLLQVIRHEAYEDPKDFEELLQVAHDSEETLDGRIRAFYLKMRTISRNRQRRLLKQPLREMMARLDGEELDIAEDDEEDADV
jgi:hypothetical protein